MSRKKIKKNKGHHPKQTEPRARKEENSKALNESLAKAQSKKKSRFNLFLIITLIFLGGLALLISTSPSIEDTLSTNSEVSALVDMYFFQTPTCPYCQKQKPIVADIQSEYPDVNIIYIDASTRSGALQLQEMATATGLSPSQLGVPLITVGNKSLVGLQDKVTITNLLDQELIVARERAEEIARSLELLNQTDNSLNESEDQNSILNNSINTSTTNLQNTSSNLTKDSADPTKFNIPFVGETNLLSLSLPLLTVVLGLIDGFNPCALWVLIFLITLLLGEKSKKKIWLVVGSFVLASAVSYFLFMTAWLNFFLFVGYIRIVTLAIGLFAIGMGIVQLKEYFTSKGDLTCEVTDADSKEKMMTKIQNLVSQPVTIGVILGIIALAFTVNAIEFVCSAAIPAMYTQILALSDISILQRYVYILMYVFFYMLDHIIIFSLAAFALGSTFTQKYAKACKVVGGIIMIVLGLMMAFAPGLLTAI